MSDFNQQYEYGANLAACAQPGKSIGMAIQMPTIGENIDRQIEVHKAAISRLEATRANMEKANLLGLKISDLREAMNY